jgi:hypothetical protein
MDDATLIPITRLEQAINYWRSRCPATGEESRLCSEAAALAAPYALMILEGRRDISPAELGDLGRDAYEAWAGTTQPGVPGQRPGE